MSGLSVHPNNNLQHLPLRIGKCAVGKEDASKTNEPGFPVSYHIRLTYLTKLGIGLLAVLSLSLGFLGPANDGKPL